ncbi:MAG: hypothetical protein WCH34_12070 [Bacteroidota bacterium]
MIIHHYDSYASKVEIYRKYICLHAYLLMVDNIQISDNSSWATLLTADIKTFSDEMILELSERYYEKVPQELEVILFIKETIPLIKKISRVKHKDRKSILLIEQYKTGIKLFKGSLVKGKEGYSNHFLITELLPFIDEKIWELNALDFMNNKKKEDVYIQPLSKSIIEREALMGLDFMIEQLYNFANFDTPANDCIDFIKIPLWRFPFTEKLNNAQINHSRNQLQPVVSQFKTHLKELSDAIFPLSFSTENLSEIKQLCHNKLIRHIAPVQQTIDESLYLIQAKKQFSENDGSTLCLGIASVETIINYFEKTETILPYVAEEIKQQVSRHFSLSSSMLFSYFEINNTESFLETE